MQEFFESGISSSLVVQVVFVNLADAEQRVEAELAARILAAKEFVLLNGRAQNVGIVEASAHFLGHLGSRDHAGIGSARTRRSEVNAAIGIDHAFIILAGAGFERTTLQSFLHLPSGSEL